MTFKLWKDKKIVITKKTIEFEQDGLLLFVSFGKLDGVSLTKDDKYLNAIIGYARMKGEKLLLENNLEKITEKWNDISIILGPIRFNKLTKIKHILVKN